MVYIDSHPQQLNLTEALAAVSTERLSGKGQDISFQTTCHNRYVYTVCRGKEQEQGSRSKSKN